MLLSSFATHATTTVTESPRTRPAEEPGLKGVIVTEFLRWYGGRYGKEEMARHVEHLSRRPVDAEQSGQKVMPFAWYPMSRVRTFLDAMVKDLPPQGRILVAREAGWASTGAALQEVYRPMFRALTSPARFRKLEGTMWRFFNNTGTGELLAERPNVHMSVVRSWAGHHPFLCEAAAGSRLVIYEAMGCRAVKIERVSCVDEGGADCRHRFTWDPLRGPRDDGGRVEEAAHERSSIPSASRGAIQRQAPVRRLQTASLLRSA